MKNYTLLFITLLFAVSVKSQTFYRPAEALKNPENVEALVIYPAKDEIMPLATGVLRFKNLHTVKITGTCDTNKLLSVNRAISRLPKLKTLIIERTDIEFFPSTPALNSSIERIELYENEMLDYNDFVAKIQATSVSELIIDVYDLQELPQNLSLLKKLSSVKVYDRNSLLFDPHKKYETGDADIKENTYKISCTEKNVTFSFSSADITPTASALEKIKTSFGADNVSQNNANVFEKNYINISPPITGVNTKKEIYTVSTNEKRNISTAGGTIIKIPERAFVDSNGVPVSGNVQIGYREFRNQADVLLSGIPMVYDSAGQKFQFESAGMFEINASVDGKEVFLAKDKSIVIEFKPENQDADFNLYYFNDTAGKWEAEAGLRTIKQKQKSTARRMRMTNAIMFYNEFKSQNKGIRYDTLRYELRFDNPEYTYLFAKKCTTKTIEVENGKVCSINKLIQIKKTGKGKGGELYFSVKNYFSAHPELSYLRDVTLVLNGSEEEFLKNVNGKYFSDARLTGDGENFQLELKNKNGITNVQLYMIKLDANGNKTERSVAPKVVWSRYSHKIRIRTKQYNRRIKKHTNFLDGYEVHSQNEIQLAAYEQVNQYMTAKEKQMSPEEFNRLADSITANNLQVGLQNPTEATYFSAREIRLSRTGNHNLDRVVEINDPVKVLVKMNETKDNGAKKGIRLKTVYAMDRTSNIVYNYPAENEITLDKKKQYLLVAFTDDGKMVWPGNETIDAKELEKSNSLVLDAKVLDKNPEGVEDLKALINLR